MMSPGKVVLAVLAAYLVGALPTGYFVIRLLRGLDVRQVGSGRTGGANAMRAGGARAGIYTAAGDITKGTAAVLIARAIAGPFAPVDMLAGLAAIIGHNWPVYLAFHGGAGATPNMGVAIALWPPAGLYLVPLLPLGLYVTDYASLTSLCLALLIMLTFVARAALGSDSHGWYVLYSSLAAGLMAWSLRPNLARLRLGSERRVGWRAREKTG